jgi:hypothetical protein
VRNGKRVNASHDQYGIHGDDVDIILMQISEATPAQSSKLKEKYVVHSSELSGYVKAFDSAWSAAASSPEFNRAWMAGWEASLQIGWDDKQWFVARDALLATIAQDKISIDHYRVLTERWKYIMGNSRRLRLLLS